MSDQQKYFQLQAFTLAGAGCSIGDTTVILSSMVDIDGNLVQMIDLGSKSWITLEPDSSSQEEQISFTGITQNVNGTATLTGVKNVAFKSPYTETSGVLKTHPGGSKAVISNTSGFYDGLTSKSDDETITGDWHVPTPAVGASIANKDYVDNTVTGIVGTASTTSAGTTRISVAPVVASIPIALGDNDARVSPVSLAALTASEVAALVGNTNGTVVPSATNTFVTQQGFQRNQEVYATGSGTSTALTLALGPTPVALIAGMKVSFKSSLTSGTSPTLNVNSLGAKSLVKSSSTGTTVLAVGDIATNVLVLVEYNGNEWQMMSPISPASVTSPASAPSAITTVSSPGTTNTDTVINCGFAPKTIAVYYQAQGTNNGANAYSQGVAIYNSAGTLVANHATFNNIASAGFNASIPTLDTTAPTVGSAVGTYYTGTLSISAVSATGYTVRVASVANGGSLAFKFLATAYQ